MLNQTIELAMSADAALNCIRDVAKTYDPTFLYVNKIGMSIFFSAKSISFFKYRIKPIPLTTIRQMGEICFSYSIKSVSDDKCELHITIARYLTPIIGGTIGNFTDDGILIEYLAEFMRRMEERLL